MRFQPASSAMLCLFALLSPSSSSAVIQEPENPKKAPASTKKTAAQASLSGCVDQKEGHYILVDDRNLEPVADLEADGFPTEGFAKHVGHKVTLRGISTAGSTRPVFKVRSIEMVSETCAPTPESDKK